MSRGMKANSNRQSGANLIEMALVLPLLILVLAGVGDLGRAFNNYIIITNAAREGARYGSHFPHYADGIRQAAIDEAANSGIVLLDTDISIEPDPDAGAPASAGQPIRVMVEFEYLTITGNIVGGQTLTLRSWAEMIVYGSD